MNEGNITCLVSMPPRPVYKCRYVDLYTWVSDLLMNDRVGDYTNGLIQVFTVILMARRKPKIHGGLHG